MTAYSPVQRPWTWETGTWFERAELIRNYHGRQRLTDEYLCHLFQLTPEGLRAILSGENWEPRYSAA